ncbi:MAG: amidohydrolase family protein [Chloroflexota bacterium]|nr:amidohydrolase family protein [Chloroflexota bacterium]
MSVIDCHQHFWWTARRAHKFPPEVGDRLDRDFTPDDLRPELAAAGVDATVLVQSLNDLDETAEYLDLQREIDFIAGVVGWVPLADSAACERALASLSGRGKLVGIRHLIAYEPDPKWLLQPGVLDSLRLLAEAGLAFEAIPVTAPQLDSVLTLAARLPQLSIVLNHMGNPPVREQGCEPWAGQIARAAELPNMSVKLSAGLAVVMTWRWRTEAVRSYADHLLARFGPQRVMAASNWPVVLLGGSYGQVWRGITDLIGGLAADEQRAVLGGNARRVYNL